jgi:hypothetical protein
MEFIIALPTTGSGSPVRKAGIEVKMERVLKILMERDDLSRDEARKQIADFEIELEEAIMSGDICECEELLNLHFGLEPDFLTDFLL